MIENVSHLVRRHVALFLTLREPSLASRTAAQFEDIAGAVIAHDVLCDRREVFMKLERMVAMCLEAPAEKLGPELVNRYLGIKLRDVI